MITIPYPEASTAAITPALSVRIGRRLDLAELERARSILWSERRRAVQLDLCLLHTVHPDAALLLYEDLVVLTRLGVRVRLLGASDRVRRILRRHPLRRFFLEGDDLFTDPDADPTGFRPSRH